MKNNKLKNKSVILLILAIFGLLCFIGGIPTIINGAKASGLLLALGIIMVVFGFYGSPMLFIAYGNCITLNRIYNAIVSEKLETTADIALQLSTPEDQVKGHVQTLITKQYLQGYLFDGQKLTTNKKAINSSASSSKCPNCGGKMTKTSDGWHCDYCGHKVKTNK